MVFAELYQTIIYFLKLTGDPEVLWIVVPLAIATVLVIFYFGIYKEERPDWSAFLSTSLVLVFVSIALLKSVLELEAGGAFNLINYWDKTIAVLLLFSIGLILVRYNFEHLLPRKISLYISSPLTINLAAYAIVLFVYSTIKPSWYVFFSLIIIIAIISIILVLIKIPIGKFGEYLEREKKRERRKDIKEAIFQRDELKKELKSREKEIKRLKLKELEGEKKEAIKLKKIIK